MEYKTGKARGDWHWGNGILRWILLIGPIFQPPCLHSGWLVAADLFWFLAVSALGTLKAVTGKLHLYESGCPSSGAATYHRCQPDNGLI